MLRGLELKRLRARNRSFILFLGAATAQADLANQAIFKNQSQASGSGSVKSAEFVETSA